MTYGSSSLHPRRPHKRQRTPHTATHRTAHSHSHSYSHSLSLLSPLSVKLRAFSKFEDTTAALSAATAICDGKLDKGLRHFLAESIGSKTEKVTLGVSDSKLGGLIKDKLAIKCVFDNGVQEVVRGIRQHVNTLIAGLAPSDTSAFQLGLSHSLARYKLKFSPDKVDTMIIQAIALLDELDKELNTYAMRVREWYGWHFPEMGKIIADNIHYAKVSAQFNHSYTHGCTPSAPFIPLPPPMYPRRACCARRIAKRIGGTAQQPLPWPLIAQHKAMTA